jgi:DHA2 family multidrug resistance protein
MMRNTGAALGISVVITLLTRHEQIHQANLVQHFSVFEGWKLSQQGARLPGAASFSFMGEMISGQKHGLAAVYRMVQAQAAILAFNDVYRLVGFLMLLLIPAAFFLGRNTAPPAAAH